MDLQIASHVVMRVYITWRGVKGPPGPPMTTTEPHGLPEDHSATSGMPQDHLRDASGLPEKTWEGRVPEYGYPGHPMKSSGPPQDHLRTTVRPDTLYIRRENCCIFVTLWGIFRKKWDIPEFSLDILRTYPYVLIINNETEDW